MTITSLFNHYYPLIIIIMKIWSKHEQALAIATSAIGFIYYIIMTAEDEND